MIYAVIVTLILGATCWFKLKSVFFKAKDNKLIKDDETLRQKEAVQREQIAEIKVKLGLNIEDLTPEQIEAFWKDNKK